MKQFDQHLENAATEHYKQLAEYEKTTLPQYIKLRNVALADLRVLILGRWQQERAGLYRAFFDRQNGPEYVAARYDKRRGAYPSRLIYLPHEFHPVRGWCPLALDQTRRVPAGTMSRARRPEQRLTDEEREGYEYLTERRQHNPDAQAETAADLLRVAQILGRNPALNILLATGAPRLRELSSGAGNALGYVTYFFDCWAKFHAYKQAPTNPAPSLPAAPLPVQDSAVETRLAYFDKLLADCRRAEHPHDTAQLLRAAYEAQAQRGIYELEDFMERLPTYVLAKLPAKLHNELEAIVLRSLRARLRLTRLRPETWPAWGVAQRGHLVARRQDVAERLAAGQGSNAAHVVERWREEKGDEAAAAISLAQRNKRAADHLATLARVDSILAALDTAAAAGVAEVRAGELTPAAGLTAPLTGQLAPPQVPSPELGALSPADKILAPGFTLEDADRLARAVGLTDETGKYCLGSRKLGAVVGFALALQQSGKLMGAIPALTAVLGPRWGVRVATRKTATGVADKYFKLTRKALARPKTTD